MIDRPFVYLAQTNPVACDLEGNAKQILDAAKRAHELGASICVTPAMSLTGWPLEGWLEREDFWMTLEEAIEGLAQALYRQSRDGKVVLVGAPSRSEGKINRSIYVLISGEVFKRIDKPLQGGCVLENARSILNHSGVEVNYCFADDLTDESFVRALKADDVGLVCALDFGLFDSGDCAKRRESMIVNCAREGIAFAVANQAGGQDDVIYEGRSFAVNCKGRETVRLKAFEADEGAVTVSNLFEDKTTALVREPGRYETLFAALVCAVRDYSRKNGFSDALLGLSGGADSALVAAIAVEALGKEHVHAVMMPTRYTSDLSLKLAKDCAENLGIDYRVRPIGAIYDAAKSILADDFAGTDEGLAEENLQARSRGLLLMALSNKFGWLTLATGNKSESATGYCTLYGDTVGGFAPIKDVLKTDVWEMLRTYNVMKGREVIPEEIITRPPSAELKEGQTDESALMPYAELDAILRGLLEEGKSAAELQAMGHNADNVYRVIELWLRSEYKRAQCPVGPKVSRAMLGRDVRLPLTSRPSFRKITHRSAKTLA